MRLIADIACYVQIGAIPAATVTTVLLPEFRSSPGDKVAVIPKTGAGALTKYVVMASAVDCALAAPITTVWLASGNSG